MYVAIYLKYFYNRLSLSLANDSAIIYYTDNQLDENIAKPVRDQLSQISQEDHLPLVSASLKKMDFGTKNVRFPSLKRGYPAMFKQDPIKSYKSLWDSINGAESWNKNIFCWCVKFEKLNSYNGKV